MHDTCDMDTLFLENNMQVGKHIIFYFQIEFPVLPTSAAFQTSP